MTDARRAGAWAVAETAARARFLEARAAGTERPRAARQAITTAMELLLLDGRDVDVDFSPQLAALQAEFSQEA